MKAHFICTPVIPEITIGLKAQFKTQLKNQEAEKLTLYKKCC